MNPLDKAGVVKAPDLLIVSDHDANSNSNAMDTGGRLLGGEGERLEKAGQLWHRLDTSFRQPRAYVRTVLATPTIRNGGPPASENAKIMCDILQKVIR